MSKISLKNILKKTFKKKTKKKSKKKVKKKVIHKNAAARTKSRLVKAVKELG